ncbi:hypothetical protein JKP88DRAFT_241020 [Tribonema minus]|uniref:Uncharacterized protein n=1 Tax=Tribonema minus TaxID=303371 RepID=A0A835Z375_9STRA|nr:hypothetical protein JKP88DRAFT_241020 [Tribonema minus]
MDKISAIKYCKTIQVASLEYWLPEEVVTEYGHAKTWVLDHLKDDECRTSVIFDTTRKAMCHLLLYRVLESKSPSIVSLHAMLAEPFNRDNMSYKNVMSRLEGFCNTKKVYLQHQELSLWHSYKTRRFLDACADEGTAV